MGGGDDPSNKEKNMTPKQAKKLRKAIKKLVNVAVERSWRRAGSPQECASLDLPYKIAQLEVSALIDNYTEDLVPE